MSFQPAPNKFNQRSILFSAFIIFLIPFFVFSCWNHPTSDDFIIGVKRHELGFWALQEFFYTRWSGRYFSTLISSLFSYFGFLYSHYYMAAALLIICTFSAWLFTFVQLNRYVLKNIYSFTTLILFSLLMLVLQLNVIPEVSTAFYWFSSAVTYQTPLLLLIIICGLIIRVFSQEHAKQKGACFLIFILIFLMHGCNEMFSIFFLVGSSWVAAFYLLTQNKFRQLVLALYSWSVLLSCLLFFSPGIRTRSNLFPPGTLLQAAGLSVAKFSILNWFFLKEPLWWFMAFFIAVLAKRHHLSFNHPFFSSLKKIPFYYWVVLYLSTGLAVYFPILYITNGSLPFRTENVICFLFSLLVLFIIYIQLSGYYIEASKETNPPIFYSYRYLLFSIVIFSSGNVEKIAQSIFTGYFYNEIMKDRKNLLENARHQNRHTVVIDDYDVAIKNKMNKYFPYGTRQTLQNILYQKPSLFFFEDNMSNRSLIQKFYGIDTLLINERGTPK